MFAIFFSCLVVLSRADPVIGAYSGGLHLAIGCLPTLNRKTSFLLGHGKAWAFNHEVFLRLFIMYPISIKLHFLYP